MFFSTTDRSCGHHQNVITHVLSVRDDIKKSSDNCHTARELNIVNLSTVLYIYIKLLV